MRSFKLLDGIGILLIIIVITIAHVEAGASGTNRSLPYRQQIRQRVLKNYDRFAFPERHIITVRVSLNILDLDLNFHTSTFTVTAWFRADWVDNRLKWNPEEYGNVDSAYFSYDEIWKPEITIANSIEPAVTVKKNGLDFIVQQYNQSLVLMVHPVVYQVYCNTDLAKWPSGNQFCSIILETVGSENTVVYMSSPQYEVELGLLTAGNNWRITRTSVNRNIYSRKKNIPTLSEVEFSFFFKKNNHQFYCNLIMLPAFAISLLLLSVFWFPPYLTEKFAITGLIAIVSCLLMVLMSRLAPVMLSQVPNIIRFYGHTLWLSAAYLVTSLVLYNVSTINSISMKPLPRTIIKFLNSKFVDYLHISIKKTSPLRTDNRNYAVELSRDDRSNFNYEDLMQTSRNDQWYQLAAVIDRLVFLTYCSIYAYMYLCYIL